MAELVIILPAHTSPVALRAITGMVLNVWQVVMKVRVGQIQLPGPEAGVNLLPAAVGPTTIGIMVPVPVEVPAPIAAAVVPLPATPVRDSAAAAVPGPIIPPVPVVIPPTLLLPPIAHPPPAVAARHLALAHPAIIG